VPLLDQAVRMLAARAAGKRAYTADAPLSFAMPASSDPLDAQLELGRRIYYNSCVYCHGIDGAGSSVFLCAKTSIRALRYSAEQVRTYIERPEFPMPRLRLTPDEEKAVAAYVARFMARADRQTGDAR